MEEHYKVSSENEKGDMRRSFENGKGRTEMGSMGKDFFLTTVMSTAGTSGYPPTPYTANLLRPT